MTFNYERKFIEQALNDALDMTLEANLDLLLRNSSEISIAHHLACELQHLFCPLSVDIEYNRDGYDPKRLIYDAPLGNPYSARSTPDIIVHKRGNHESNLLVIEIKKMGNSASWDKLRLEMFKEQLGYLYAASVQIGLDSADNPCHKIAFL